MDGWTEGRNDGWSDGRVVGRSGVLARLTSDHPTLRPSDPRSILQRGLDRSDPVRSRILTLGVVSLLAASPAVAQNNPDLALTPAERDSILADYDNIFPLLGRKAIERGIRLPRPLGINLIAFWAQQDIEISELGLSTGDNPTVPIDGIEFGSNKSSAFTTNVRAELWVLPFLNVYALAGVAAAKMEVELTEPIPFTSKVDQDGEYGGFGITGAFGIRRFFTIADVNRTWTDLEKLSEPVQSRVFSLRVGRAFPVGGKKRLGVWAGTMNVNFASETSGSIALAEAIPPETVDQIRDRLENIENQEWYQNLTPVQQAVVNQIVDRLLAGDASDVIVNYSLQKKPATAWNLLLGANLDFNDRWSVRTEVGLIGRYSVLLGGVYRLDL